MLDFTLQDVEKALGQQGKKVGREYHFQCPVCKDTHEDNLSFNPDKGVLKCFSCLDNEGAKYVIDMINVQRRYDNTQKSPYLKNIKPIQAKPLDTPKKWEINKDKFIEYMCLASDILQKDKELQKILLEKRGITKETAELCGLGFDPTENHWVIPIFSLKYDCLMSFEYRPKDFGTFSNGDKVKRERGYEATISPIYGLNKAKTLIICEGFLDGFLLTQYMLQHKLDDFTIYSCSNGVGSLANCLNEIKFGNFKEIKLMLDNDPLKKNGDLGDGEKFTQKILEKYPFIKDSRAFLKKAGVKDFTDWYMKNLTKI